MYIDGAGVLCTFSGLGGVVGVGRLCVLAWFYVVGWWVSLCGLVLFRVFVVFYILAMWFGTWCGC